MLKERLSTPSIRCINSGKLGQTNVNEFLDAVVMKKARPTPFQLLTVICSALLILISHGRRKFFLQGGATSGVF